MLKIGDEAPDFLTTDESGNQFSLREHRGSKLVLFFYPADNSVGCTMEACSLRDSYTLFEGSGIPIYGISGGDEASHKKFKRNNDLPFGLLMDEDYMIAKLYDVYKPIRVLGKELLGVKRVTFLIDENGKIEGIFGGDEGIDKVRSSKHADQLVSYWGLKL